MYHDDPFMEDTIASGKSKRSRSRHNSTEGLDQSGIGSRGGGKVTGVSSKPGPASSPDDEESSESEDADARVTSALTAKPYVQPDGLARAGLWEDGDGNLVDEVVTLDLVVLGPKSVFGGSDLAQETVIVTSSSAKLLLLSKVRRI